MVKHTFVKHQAPSIDRNGSIRAKIDFPGVRVDITTKGSLVALREVRKIVDSLRSMNGVAIDEEFEDMGWDCNPRNPFWLLSEEARTNQRFMEFIKLATKAEEQCVYRRISIVNKKIVDALQQKVYSSVSLDDIRQAIRSALYNVRLNGIRLAAIHVMGDLPESEREMIFDSVAKSLGKIDLRRGFTQKDVLGKTLIELVLFGKGQSEDV